MLAGCAVALRITLHWTPPSTGVPARQLPLLIETAAAAAIGLVTRSPFGEPERATGRWLPFLRLGTAVAGGSLCWIGPLSFWALAAYAIGQGWTTPLAWPARAPHDSGALLCAAGVFAAGLAVTAVLGARDSARE